MVLSPDNIFTLSVTGVGTVVGVLLGFLATKVYNQLAQPQADVKELAKVMNDLKLTILKLSIEVRHATRVARMYPKVVQDLNRAHQYIKELRTQVNGQ